MCETCGVVGWCVLMHSVWELCVVPCVSACELWGSGVVVCGGMATHVWYGMVGEWHRT